MRISTVVEVPGLELEAVREEFIVGLGHTVCWTVPGPGPDGVERRSRHLYPIYTNLSHSPPGAFTGVMWDSGGPFESGFLVGYDEEFGEDGCAGWSVFVRFIERLAAEGRISEAHLVDVTDEGVATTRHFESGGWKVEVCFEDEGDDLLYW